MSNSQTKRTKKVVITAFFAAIIYLGIQAFRIPLPAGFGTPFVHFGHIFIMLAIICLGGKMATVAGVIGLLIFDLVNGYIHAIPNVFVSTVINCFLVGTVHASMLRKANGNTKSEHKYAIFAAVLYGVSNTVIDFVWNLVQLMIIGNSFQVAFMTELTSIPATIINAVFTVIGIAVLYIPVITAYRRIIKG